MSEDHTPAPVAATTNVLYNRVALLVTGAVSLGTVGALITPSLPWGVLLLLSILWVVATIPVVIMAAIGKFSKEKLGKDVSPTYMLVAAAFWTLLSGVVSGPALHMYSAELGPKTVLAIFSACCAAMAVCGAIGMGTSKNLDGLRRVLYTSLWVLILVSFVGIFFAWTPVGDMLFGGISFLVFCGYFVVDFNRLKNERAAGADDWGTAVLISVALYLDLLNALFSALRAYSGWKRS